MKKLIHVLLLLTLILVLSGCSGKVNKEGNLIYNKDGELLIKSLDHDKDWKLIEKGKKIGRNIMSKDKIHLAFEVFNNEPRIYVYNFKRNELIKKIENVHLIGVSPNKEIALTYDENTEVKLFDLKTKKTKELGIEYGDLSWSPDGNKIVYTKFFNDKKYRLFIKNLKTNETRELVPDTEENIQENCYWSPTGDKIAFTWNKNGPQKIYTVNPDGSDLRKITSSRTTKECLSISPDGKYILFNTVNRIKKSNGLPKIVGNIYKVDMNGNNLEQLTFDKYKLNTQPYMINSD